MSFLIQHICQRGWRMLISYEDELMCLPHSTHLSEGVTDFWSLMKISCCDYTIQHICQKGWWNFWFLMKISWCDYITPFNIFVKGGGGSMILYEYKTYKLMVLPHSTRALMSWHWWWWWWWGDLEHDDDDDDDDGGDDDDDCKCGATSGLDGTCLIHFMESSPLYARTFYELDINTYIPFYPSCWS